MDTPKTQNNALLLAGAGNTNLLPILKPGNDSDTDEDAADATDGGDSALSAMSPQIAGLPTAPTPPLPSAPLQPAATSSATQPVTQTVALPPQTTTTATQPAVQSATHVATSSLAAQIPIIPPAPEPPSLRVTNMPLPMLRPSSAEAPGVSDGVVLSAVDAKRFWGVQVGAYSRYTPAHSAAERAQQNLPFQIKDTRIAVDEAEGRSGKLYRARLVGLAQNEATDVCRELRARQIPCLVVQSTTAMAMVGNQ
jgi:SPOR domain